MGSISLQTHVSAIIGDSIRSRSNYFSQIRWISLLYLNLLFGMTLLQVTSMACCPIAQYVVVGTATGDVLFVEMTTKQKPRLVHRVHLYHVPVDHLVWVSLHRDYLLSYFLWIGALWTECWEYCILYLFNRFDQGGNFLITGASDSRMFVLNARPSKGFEIIGWFGNSQDDIHYYSILSIWGLRFFFF